jgi:hypothetical protein
MDYLVLETFVLSKDQQNVARVATEGHPYNGSHH